MNISEMISLVEAYIDDLVDTTTCVTMLNAGQSQMETEAQVRFPPIVQTVEMDFVPPYPEIYHEIPVLYAAAMYKAQDSSIREKDSFMAQFYDRLRSFVANYDPPVQYLNRANVQQFDAAEDQTVFTVTKTTYNAVYGNPVAYVNGNPVDAAINDRTVTLPSPAAEGAIVTVMWDDGAVFRVKPALYVGW